MTKNDDKCVPALRFKGFNNDWAQRKLKDLTDVRDGTHSSPKYVEAGHPFITSKNINNGSIDYRDIKYITDEDFDEINKRSKVDIHDILMGMIGTVGNLALIDKKPNFAIKNIALIKDIGKIDYLFLYNFLQSNYVSKELIQKLDGGTQKFISLNKVRDLNISVASFQEQKAISKCLMRVNNLLILQQRKFQQLKLLKKAMLQDLFADKAVPKLRFRGFKDYWVPKKLGDIANFINGRAYKQNELLDKGKYKVLRVGNFYTNDSWYFSNLELKPQYYINKGDLVYTWSATFGPHIWRGEKVIYHYHIWKINLSKSLNKKFVFYLLKADKAKLLSNTNGSTMIHITKRNMESKTVLIPNTIEQSQIRNSLDNVSNLITFQQEKIAEVKQIKQFLLQNMFI
ncbi:restriction endonuclease subunit S [Lactobacillus sp. UMNPBX12]|uniref:restriction endonuclease subunit S n=1 Tax=Lactobacillus sp. UMNPBX12 TaxID=2042035 RepID=UPI000BEEA6D5|nr:restriction endonuclease subunit S [Lactobacillus sp. UMNPBX12]PEG90286.1 type I restriction endonuclease subunit S [Lactobacillus sp. UMNPBX12]